MNKRLPLDLLDIKRVSSSFIEDSIPIHLPFHSLSPNHFYLSRLFLPGLPTTLTCSHFLILFILIDTFLHTSIITRTAYFSRIQHFTAVMAAFAPPQPPASRPLPADFAPSSPPDQSFYPIHNGRHEPLPTLPINENNRVQHRQSTDFKANGQAAAFVNGDGGLPVPNGMQHPPSNGSARHRATASMGAFDGPRSPPNTKSMSHRP